MTQAVKVLNNVSAGIKRITENRKIDGNDVSDVNKRLKGLANILLTAGEACQVLKISEPTLIRRRRKGLVPYIQLGCSFYYLNTGGTL